MPKPPLHRAPCGRLARPPVAPRLRWRALALFAAFAFGGLAACHSAAPPPPPSPPPELPPPEPSVPPERPPEPPTPDPLAAANSAYSTGTFGVATSAYKDFLSANPDSEGADRALIQLALLYTLPESSVADPAKGRARLRTLVERFPASPYAPQAQSLLALMAEIERLRGDLQRQKQATDALRKNLEALKRIDLQGQKPPGS